MPEVTTSEANRIRLLVDAGKTPDEAFAIVLAGRESAPPAAEPPKRKASNQQPAGKRHLKAWLHERADVVEEYQFHPERKWRFDFYLPEYGIAVEYEGFLAMGANAAHSAVSGIMRDVEKYNEATAMGIRVFRAHAENTRTGSFFTLMERVLSQGGVS